ncbi:hypothetical protein QTP88_028622 [Uroleucon formosanum]
MLQQTVKQLSVKVTPSDVDRKVSVVTIRHTWVKGFSVFVSKTRRKYITSPPRSCDHDYRNLIRQQYRSDTRSDKSKNMERRSHSNQTVYVFHS